MKRMMLMGLCLIAVFAFTAASAFASSPKNVTVSTPGKGKLSGVAVNDVSHNLVFTTGSGNLECTTVELEGTVNKNGEKKDVNAITRSEEFGGESPAPSCKTAFGPGPTHSANLPWESIASSKGYEVKGKKISFTTEFLVLPPPDNTCTFEASKNKATWSSPLTTTPQIEKVVVTAQKFKHNKKAADQAEACPTEGTLSGSFEGEAGGEPVEYALTA